MSGSTRHSRSPLHGAPLRLAAVAMLLPLAVVGLGLAACGGADEREPDEIDFGEETVTDDDYFADEPEPVVGTATVEVRLHGRTIEMPRSLPAGETTFIVTNTGEHEHSFEIEGNGIERGLASNLAPGETGELTVDLEPGTYTVYCPVGDHREGGMVVTLEVER